MWSGMKINNNGMSFITMYDHTKPVAVVGGGTAGWFTALMVKSHYPYVNVVLIESDEIGILGAGEGTTPHFIDLLDEIKISIDQVIKHADATLKNGIRFENWNGDNRSYFHSFVPDSELNQVNNFNILAAQLARFDHVLTINFPEKLTDHSKVPFIFGKKSTTLNSSLVDYFDINSNFGLHFNARKLAKFFSDVGQSRGITRIQGRITEFINNESGYVQSIRIDTQESLLDVGFVFDCSGFARLCLGKHYNTEWESYDEYLPMNTAIPFFIPHDNAVKPETLSRAMSSGWMWQIPVRDRYGCGYVFDNNFITEDQALAEAEQHFGHKLEVPKTFRFRAGSYRKTLVKNCLAIGLSQSFVEPLEATSIWIAYKNLSNFMLLNGLNCYQSQLFQDRYNLVCLEKNRDVRDFLYLHYLTKRNDSEFWKTFRSRHKMIPSVEQDIDIISSFSDVDLLLNNKLFHSYSWIQISVGLGLLDTKQYQESYKLMNQTFVNRLYDWCVDKQNNYIKQCMDHKEFVDFMLT